MSNNVNSYADNLAKLTAASNEILKIASGFNATLTGNNEEVFVSNDISMPSYENIVNRVKRVESTVANFTQGRGLVETEDGTYRKISVTTIPAPAPTIVNIPFDNTFSINSNWFFESLQYPKCTIKIDLKDKIEDTADRIYINRVILDSTETINGVDSVMNFYNNSIKNANIPYIELIALLENNGIQYSEDISEISLPLTYEKYKGEFSVAATRFLKNENGVNELWLYLDTIQYNEIDENGVIKNAGILLEKGDYLRYKNSLYKISDISVSQNRIKLEYAVGFETVGVDDVLEFYNEPFSEKIAEIGIGINEINILYVKGVNENYNILSREWSEPIAFYTNELSFEENPNITFEEYYRTNVADFGQNLIAQAKEKQVYAFHGLTPNSPVLNLNGLKVVQINTQLNATLDTESYNTLTSEIASTKSNISAVRTAISANKDKLIQATTQEERNNLQNLIDTDTNTLNTITTQYNTLVNELNTLLNEAGAINYSPKYHIRGFFEIPQSRFLNEEKKLGEQAVIAFEIKYRYLHTDETGVKLDSYEYTDSNDTIQTGVFSDWNLVTSETLEKKYDSSSGQFKWVYGNAANGAEININQIDIPIRSGEKVEIKVRSISEAGYPYNPLKSAWSNSVIVEFPKNLTSNDSVTTVLETVKSDLNAVVLQETLSAAGVYTHLNDSNSVYKHSAANLGYTEITNTDNGTETKEMSVQDKLAALTNLLAENQKTINTLQDKITTMETSFASIAANQ